MIARAGAVAWLALAVSACGHAMFVRPAGPGVPAANAPEAWASATADCRQSQNYKALLHVSGRAGGDRLWPFAVETALTSDGAIYMSATTSGQSIFVLSGTAKQATLWLKREDRAVVAPPGAIVEAILGVPLAPDRLLSVLTGCITRTFDVTSSAQHNSILTIQTSDARVFLEHDAAGWRARAGDVDGFSVELGRKGSALPENVWIRTPTGRSPEARLDVKVSEAETNSTIPVSFFTPPAGAARAQPMKLEELRFSGGRSAGPHRDNAVRRALTLRPFAKVNLMLRVGARQPDGYHDVRTVLQAVGIFDSLTFTARRGPFALQSRAPGLASDESNLVWRAAAALWRAAGKTGTPRDAHVKLDKAIPMAAGLGGGSADAAAALVGLNHLWDFRCPPQQLVRIARELGADVPFFLQGGTALGTGRGDEIFPVDDIARFGVVLIKPSFGVSTADAYAWLDADRMSAAASPVREPRALDVGWAGHSLTIANDLEAPVARRHPGIEEMIAACVREGAVASAMTGSGSAVFGLFREAVAAKAARKLQRPDWLVLLTRTLSRRESGRRITL